MERSTEGRIRLKRKAWVSIGLISAAVVGGALIWSTYRQDLVSPGFRREALTALFECSQLSGADDGHGLLAARLLMQDAHTPAEKAAAEAVTDAAYDWVQCEAMADGDPMARECIQQAEEASVRATHLIMRGRR